MNLYDALGIDLSALTDDLLRRNADSPSERPYLSPSEIPLTWQTKGKLVTLDAAVMTCHLIAARVAFKGFPGLLASVARQVQSKVSQNIENSAIDNLVETGSTAAKRVGFIVGLVRKVGAYFQRATIEVQKEGKIRLASIKARTDLYEHALRPKPGNPRATKLVHTRHKSPKQRKANKR